MKKSLIAVAALAAVGAASAQSSVTLYGIVDTGFGVEQTKNKVSTTATVGRVSSTVTNTDKNRRTGALSGGLSGSRWGLKGQEDLGNGLSAVFNVEAGFDSATGAFKGGFNRRSVVGLKGGFGQVLLGLDNTPLDSVGGDYQASTKVTEDSLTYATRIDPITGAVLETAKKELYTGKLSGIHYEGEFSGFGVKASAGYTDVKTTKSSTVGATEIDRTRDEGYGVGISYTGGPVSVGAAVQQFRVKTTKGAGAAVTNTSTKRVEYGVGATYDFTAAKLYAHYLASDARDQKPIQQFGVGVTVPFGAFTLGAQYAYNYWKAPAGVQVASYPTMKNDKIKGHDFVLQGTYALSKRTDVYAIAARTNSWKVKNSIPARNVSKTAQTHTDSFAVGLRHRF